MSYYVVRLATLGRGILMALIPLGVAFTLVGRMGSAAGLHLARRRGHAGARRWSWAARRPSSSWSAGSSAARHRPSRSSASSSSTARPPSVPHRATATAGANDHAGGRNGHASGGGGDALADGSADGIGRSNGNGHGGGSSAGDSAGTAPGTVSRWPAPAGSTGRAPIVQPDPQVVAGAVARTGAETVIIAGALAPGRLRDIAWRLEGTGVDLW